MIEFQCPGCTSQHAANEAFAGLRARCVVCGVPLVIPGESHVVAMAAGPASLPRPRPVKPTKPAPRRPGVVDLAGEPEPDDFDLGGTPEPEGSEFAPPKATRPARASAAPEVADEVEDEVEETTAAPDAAGLRKRRLRLAAAVAVTVVCVSSAVLTIARAGGEKPQLPQQPAGGTPVAQAPKAPPEKKAKVEEKKPAPRPVVTGKPEVAPPPREVLPAVAFTAARLRAERDEDPFGFDARYMGKALVIRGTHGGTRNGVITLSDTTASETKEEESITCLLPRSDSGEVPAGASLQLGQPVTVRGTYTAALRLNKCEVVRTGSPADPDFKDRWIELTGFVRMVNPDEDGSQFPVVSLEPTTTDSPVAVNCLFRVSERDRVDKLRRGQPVIVRGWCTGRTYRVVQLHNCALVGPTDPTPATLLRVPIDRLFAAYEADLLPAPRVDPNVAPIPVSAERLASAFKGDPKAANAEYRGKAVEVTGRVVERRPQQRTVIMEAGTDTPHQVAATFTAERYDAVRESEELTVRGICAGVRDRRYVRIENAERFDPVYRTTPEFLPLQPGREYLMEFITPTRSKDNPITQIRVRYTEGDLIHAVPLRTGTFPGATLFGTSLAEPKWNRDLPRNTAPVVSQFRVSDGRIEFREVPPPPALASPWWDPVLKLELKKGEGWTTDMPDGHKITYTVTDFRTDQASQRLLVEIQRVIKDPKNPGTWDEAAITYAWGVGEVRRTVARHSASAGRGVVVLESRLVGGIPQLPAGPKLGGGKGKTGM